MMFMRTLPRPFTHCVCFHSRALKAEKDLKLLLNVHSNISKDRRDKVTISLSMQKAKDSLSELKSKISTGEIGGESESRKLLQQTADKLSTADAALKEKTATEEVLIQELESTGATLDEIQEQNGTDQSPLLLAV